jgi:hypothetical protein
MNVIDIFGTLGSLLVLFAYHYLSKEGSPHAKTKYQMINIVGGLLLAIYTYNCMAYASTVTNIIWIGIGLNSLKPRILEKIDKILGTFRLKRIGLSTRVYNNRSVAKIK